MKLWPEMEYQRLRNYKTVAHSIELSRRTGQLSFTHHEEVAYLKLIETIPDKKLSQGQPHGEDFLVPVRRLPPVAFFCPLEGIGVHPPCDKTLFLTRLQTKAPPGFTLKAPCVDL
jgi:hypothetical protein